MIFCVVFFSHAESAESYEAQSDEKLGSGRFCEFCEFCVKLLSTFFLRENDKLICLIGKFTLLLQRQTFKNLYVMKKNYLFPHYFQWIGLAIAVISFVALCVGPNMDFSIRMPALYNGDISFDEESNSGGLIFLGFSKEKVEDEFVQYLRSQSLIWSTYVTAGLFILGTLLIYGITYLLIPYMVFFVFLLLFILKFKIALHHYNKGGAK